MGDWVAAFVLCGAHARGPVSHPGPPGRMCAYVFATVPTPSSLPAARRVFNPPCQFTCTPSEAVAVPLPSGALYTFCPYPTGESILARFAITTSSPDGNAEWSQACVVLAILCVSYRVVALAMLNRIAFQTKDQTR